MPSKILLKRASSFFVFFLRLTQFSLLTPHKDIVGFYGFAYDPISNFRAIITEFCEKGSLFDLLHTNERKGTSRSKKTELTNKSFLEIKNNREKMALQISRALKHLHDFGFAHLDLTSRNILVSNEYDAKLSDFGLTSLLHEGIGTRQPNHGPSYWKAPEMQYLDAISKMTE